MTRRRLVAAVLACLGMLGCPKSSDIEIARKVKLQLSERAGMYPHRTSLALDLIIDGQVWIRDHEVRFVAVDPAGSTRECVEMLTMGEPGRSCTFYYHFDSQQLASWLQTHGEHEVTAILGTVRSNPIKLTLPRR